MKRTIATGVMSMMIGLAGVTRAQQPAAAPPAAAQPGEARDQAAKAQEGQARLKADQDALIQRKMDAEFERAKAMEAQMRAGAAATGAKQAAIDQAHRAFFFANNRPNPNAVVKKETVAHCGVSTTEVIPALTEQLRLTHGMGLLVDYVEPGSPAEQAGVRQYDVLMKFDDQMLTNPEQMRALVRMKKPSDDVKLSLIRGGQPTSVNVELGQKEVDVVAETTIDGRPMGNAMAGIYGYGGAGGGAGGGVGSVSVSAGGGAMGGGVGQALVFQPNGAATLRPPMVAAGGGAGGYAVTNVNGRNQMAWADGRHTLEMELRDGKAVNLKAKDRTGNEIFNGPVETDAQRQALPNDLAAALTKAESHTPFGRPKGARVLTSTENDTLLIARFEGGKAVHAFAFSTADGKTLYDGPCVKTADRQAIPDAVAKQLETLEKNQSAAGEFGVIGKNGGF